MKFRYYKPKDKVHKLYEYFELLDDLFHVQKGYTEEDFLYRIESSKGTNAPEKEFIFQTLLSYGLIAETNDHVPHYVLSHPYRTFLEYLNQDSQPVNSLVIQGYIASLDQCIEDLNKAYSEDSTFIINGLKYLNAYLGLFNQIRMRMRMLIVPV